LLDIPYYHDVMTHGDDWEPGRLVHMPGVDDIIDWLDKHARIPINDIIAKARRLQGNRRRGTKPKTPTPTYYLGLLDDINQVQINLEEFKECVAQVLNTWGRPPLSIDKISRASGLSRDRLNILQNAALAEETKAAKARRDTEKRKSSDGK